LKPLEGYDKISGFVIAFEDVICNSFGKEAHYTLQRVHYSHNLPGCHNAACCQESHTGLHCHINIKNGKNN